MLRVALPSECRSPRHNAPPGGKAVMAEDDDRPARCGLAEHATPRGARRGEVAANGHPIRVLDLARMVEEIAHIEKALPARADPGHTVTGRFARRGDHRHARRHFTLPVDHFEE